MRDTLREAVEDWKTGETVWTAELGGLGPGYEQAIQILLWELCADHLDEPLPPNDMYGDWGKETISRLDEACLGFSGAQVGAAKSTAWKFLKYGYKEMMDKLDKERHIQASKGFPRVEA